MQITIELNAGPNSSNNVTKADMRMNIDALQRAIDGKSMASDTVLLLDTKSILDGIMEKLPSA